jgi:hypothetical protein|tara:strand:- start:46 stop:363 length:318 start_codon:yes stop_codon:yes gene_type:complete
MKNIGLLIILVLTGCNHSATLKPEDTKVCRSADMQQEIDYLLALDEAYKMEEKIYLEEIRKAQINDDEIAFQFFLREYAKVKRLDLPEWIKKEPNYIQGGVNIKY